MAKKKEVSQEIKELKTQIQAGTIIIGADRSLKSLKSGQAKIVYLASNTPTSLKQDIEHYARLSQARVITLEQDNEELGTLCKKNFFISVLASAQE